MAVNVEQEDDGKKLFLEDSFRPDPAATDSRWSMDAVAVASHPRLAETSEADNSVNHFALVSVPKKTRGLGVLFKRSERK